MAENNHQQKQNFYQGIIIGTVFIFIIFLAFFAGLKIGQRRVFDKRYPPMFYQFLRPPKEGFIPRRFQGHGLVGVVDSVSKESFVVKNRWGELVTVLVNKDTQYKMDNKNASFSDIKKGKNVMVIGEPKEEEIGVVAKIIRIF
ncbi:MAG: DUF5666 domain-containing protein [Microgenomates group bacterium]|nr:DUF5666 domain-containing protein [Microgenomates group bacterium]